MQQEELYRVFHKGVSGSRKNSMYPVNDPNEFIDKATSIINKSPNADYYESIYVYQKEHIDILKKTDSLAGIQNVKTNRVVLDFDSEDSVDLAKQDAIVALDRLTKITPNANTAIRIFYSGNKGFHLEVHLNEFITRPEFENMIYGLAGDLKTFDQKVKDQQRLFRFPLTKNIKTKQYKIPLTQDQLVNATIPEIQSLSKSENHDPFYDILSSYITIDLPNTFKSLKKKESLKKVEIDMQKQTDRPDMSKKPKHLTAAKFALQEGYFEEGERNEACMILASTYKYLGYNQEHTYNIIKATLRMRCHRLGLPDYDKKELWTTIIQPIYSPTWKGGTFSEEDGLLKSTIDRYDLDKIDIYDAGLVSLTSIADQYRDFATNIAANTIKLGIDQIDQKLRITTSMLVAFLAAPSAGKSSVSFGILNTVSKTGEKSLFFSMDMSIPQVYQRLIQRHTGHHSDQIVQNYEKGNQSAIENYDGILAKEYPNVKFSFKSGLTTDQIRATIVQEQQSTGVMPKLVILDYLECISAGGIADSTQSKAVIATALKGICNELGICIILLTQPRMAAGGPAGELNSYTDIKGSSVISEASATVITMSRPGFSPKNPEDDNYVTLNIVKNRMGTLSSTDLYWDGLTGNIRSLSHDEENDLKALRSAIAQAKSTQNSEDMY